MRWSGLAILSLLVGGCATSPASPAPATPHPILAQAISGNPGTAPPSADSPTPPVPVSQPASLESSEDRADRHVRRTWGWVALSVGAEASVVAIITSFMMLHQSSVRSADCSNKVCSADGLSANTTLQNLEWWNAGAWTVAVAGLGAGTYLLLTSPSDKALHAEVGIAPTGSGSGLLLRGSF